MSHERSRRDGSTLVELLVALPLIALLGTLGVALLLTGVRQGSDLDTRLGGARELRHAAHTLTAELRTLRPEDVIAWSDTSVEFHALLGAGIACGTRGARDAIHITENPALAPAWRGTVGPGDVAHVALAPSAAGAGPSTLTRTVADVRTTTACAATPGALASPRTLSLVLDTPLPTQPMEGAPVRVTQRTRYALYRASDALWYLGRRTWNGAAWDVVQPVVGPLHSATRQGIRLRALDTLGALLPPAATARAGGFAIELRAPRGALGARTDSVAVRIALRSRRMP